MTGEVPSAAGPSLWAGLMACFALLALGCSSSYVTSDGAAVASMPTPSTALPRVEPFTTTTTTATIAPPSTRTVPTGDAQLLATLRVAAEVDDGAYTRDAFNYPGGGTDSRGCNTRARVLQRDSTVPAQVDYPGCKVLAGRWVDATTGTTYEDPGAVSIDHLVPLKEAYVSGAASWPSTTMVAFGNDVDRVEALKVIGGSGNASKGHKDPAKWNPPLQSAWPAYARSWLVVKVAYGLTADQAEIDALRSMLALPPASAIRPALAMPATNDVKPSQPPTTTNSSSYYVSCAAARAAGKAPLRRGEPGYRPGLDRDNDGIACKT